MSCPYAEMTTVISRCFTLRLYIVFCLCLCVMQVEELSAELHERKKKEKSRVEAETQTEEYIQVETGALTHTQILTLGLFSSQQ